MCARLVSIPVVPYQAASETVENVFKGVIGHQHLKGYLKDICAIVLDKKYRKGRHRKLPMIVLEGPPGRGKSMCARLIKG